MTSCRIRVFVLHDACPELLRRIGVIRGVRYGKEQVGEECFSADLAVLFHEQAFRLRVRTIAPDSRDERQGSALRGAMSGIA